MMDPGGTNPGFNFTFIIYLIICGLLTIFFLLYFNRLFGSIVSYVIRTYTWHRYRIYIDIRALQISLLGGRVFFTGLRYHGFNETFLVQHGDITWRYWLRRVRESDIRISRSATEVASADREKNDSLPCRINVKLVGLEWFVYNRSPAYESILANLVAGHSPASPHSSNLFDEKDGVESKHAETQTPNAPADASSSPGNQSRRRQTSAQTKTSHNSGPGPVEAHSRTNSSSVGAEDQDKSAALPFFLQLLPIHVECTKPALVMGNDNTKAILIVKANTANVDVDASESKTCDRYMQMFKVQLNRAVIEMKENDAFKEDQDSRATRQREDAQASEPPPQRSFLRRYRRKAISSLRNMVPYWRRSVESFSADSRGFFGTGPSTIPASGQWQGLSRYLDDQYLDDKSRWASAEYAAVPTILDSPEATLTLYWDAVSRVTEQAAVTRLSSSSNNVNGSTPPAWGINVSVKGGTMNYGPWADRQRADLQRVFFPSIAKDASPAVALPAGAWRVATQFKMLVELEDAITLRIPIREQSRNWRWRGKEPPIRHLEGLTKRRQRNKSKKNSKGEGSSARPAGWLEIKVPANATVAYTMDMLAKPSGYENHLDIDLPSTELWSSVNHDILWKSGPQRISCDLSNPLPWNTLRSWHFTVDCDDMKLYLLRDHVFLLTDLVDDWASGPPSEYLVFTPYKYYLHLNLRRVQLFVNVNDENIIDKPTALDDNAYLILATPLLNTELTIPLDQFRPNKTTIPFDIRTNNVELSLHTPQSSTHAAFLSSNELGYAEALVVSGSYQYNSTTSPANTDTLVVKVHGQSPYAYLYGFVIRYLLLLKDNYFGDHVHFKTLDEYQDQLQAKEQGTKSSPGPPSKKSNDLDIILALKVDDPRIMLPINLYSAGRYVQCELASVSIDLRFTNYYMDMELDVSPLSLSIGNHGNTLESPSLSYSNTQLFIDGVRVSGHRAFGLPPSEPTYLCNWDVAVGDIDGECTPDFLASLAKGGAAFAFTFDDVENALVPYSSLVFYDITFVHLSVNCVNLRVHIDEAAFLLSTGPISVNSNDWARSHYSKKAVVTIPGIEISCVDAESASRHKSLHQHPVKTMAFFKTDIHLTTIGRKFGFTQERKVQQDLVRREDQRTSRIPFLLLEGLHDDFVPDLFDPPAQCSPLPLPYPVLDVDNEKRSYQGSSAPQRSQGLKSQRSFLSLSGSSGSSVLSRQNRPEGRAKSKGLLTTDELNASPPYDRMNDSASSSHQSASRMEMGEPSVKDVHDHNSVAFSSQYFAPHFPLRDVQPDTRDAAFPNEREVSYDEIFQQATADLDDIDPQDLSEDHAHSSVLVEFPTGISALVNPEAVRYATSLLSELQPSEPDDILDALQISSINEVFGARKQEHVRGKILDLLVRLPHANVRFLNSSSSDTPDDTEEEEDQYSVLLSGMAVLTRTVSECIEPTSSRTSLHFRLDSAEVSASERPTSLHRTQAAVMLEIESVVASLGTKDIMYIDADVGSIVGSTASGKVEYLASLIHRTGSAASDLERLLVNTTSRHSARVKYLTYHLLEEGQSTNDPSFLIRPSAVLRSARRHLRTVDSWKMIMRLRQIWATMASEPRSQLLADCRGTSSAIPPHTPELVIAAFQRWRSWDLEDAQSSVLLKNIFGRMPGAESNAKEYPLLGACRLGQMRFVLDPGPKQNNIGFTDVNIRIEKTVERANSTLPEVPAFKGPLTVVNLCCSDAAIHLNWELCELADDVLALYNQNKAQHLGEPKTVKLPDQPRERTLSAIHVVLEVVKGSLDVETVNLASKTLGDGIKASILKYNTTEQNAEFASLVLNCNAVTSRLHSQADLLGMFQLRQPSVFLSHELEVTDNVPLRTIKATASSQGMVLAVKQDLIVLLEVLDRLVLDEAAQLHRLLAQLPETPRDSGTAKVVDRLSKVRINAAVFLDGYSITIPLLESLTYKITGVVARVSCAANYGQELIFDFDVKENSHEVQIDVRNEPRSISLFHIPPTNGRIMNRTNQSENALTVSSSVEVIQVDASAIYSLLAALNRPQVSNATREVQDQASLIQEHISDVFRPSKPASPKVNSMPQPVKLAYNVHVTLAGLQILAQTALKSTTEPRAQILFSLDQVYLQVCNQPDPSAPALEYPELRVNLRQIGLDIRRGRDGAMRSCGSLGTSITVSASPCRGDDRTEDWQFNFHSDDLDVNLSPETVSTVIDVVGYMGSKIKELDTSRELEYLRKLRQSKPRITINDGKELGDDTDILDSVLSSVVYNFELRSIRVCWDVADVSTDQDSTKEDLVLSIQLIEFGTRTRKSARLTIENLQLQTVSPGQDKNVRSPHSALLPQVIFNVAYMSTAEARRMAFQATGESLDLRLTSGFIVPAANLVESISLSMKNVQNASAQWTTASTKKKGDAQPSQRQRSMLGNKRLENLLVDADFAGAVVYISSKGGGSDFDESQDAKYDEPDRGAVLRSPGLAWKAEYRDNGEEDPSLHGEVKIDASSNILYPCVVPLVLDMMSNMKRVVSESSKDSPPPQSVIPKLKPEKSADEDNILAADPSAVLGRLRLNLGLRICRQEFSLSCQPFARVAATTCYDNVYFTINTVTSQEQGNFFAISGTLTKPRASVQHVYSRESTASFELETVTLSFMNSKHVSGTTGVSAILKVSPMKVSVNAKQLQDFLLFREIWYPEDLRRAPMVPVAKLETETSQGHLVQRYQQVAATAAFPWTATISIAALDVNVDLGQAIGKSVFRINDFWVSSKKTSDWEQTLCLGFDKISVDCAGRLSGFVALQDFRLRTSIQWPQREEALNETPLIQASLGFNALRVKAAFDYQAFLVADITSLEFLMYNVRQKLEGAADRLVAIFDGDAVQVFGTATSAAQGLALYQAVQKLIQERKENFEASLRDMEKLMKRTSNPSPNASRPSRPAPKLVESDSMAKSPISLDTDVVVTLKALNLGVFPGTFSDHQVFKMEALNAYARFAASVEQRRIHSILRMTLGQLRIGLAGVRDVEAPKTLSEMTVEDVVQRSTGSRGGTILKVPRVEAVMETWQAPNSNHIDYIFKSAFEGKVEVGWNYSRVSYIRGMWANHSKSLEQTWGRQLPMAAVKITGVPEAEKEQQEGEQQKITAEVHVPQSKYEYQALEPPIIETPQLRDMGEATPPLEWIGLHRDKLPNLTHQIAIVSLLELAGEVEDAYSRILGSS